MAIDKKLDKIQEDVSEIKTHLAVYNSLLDVHIKRTDILEEKIEPLEKHVNMIKGAIALITILATIAAIAEVFLR